MNSLVSVSTVSTTLKILRLCSSTSLRSTVHTVQSRSLSRFASVQPVSTLLSLKEFQRDFILVRSLSQLPEDVEKSTLNPTEPMKEIISQREAGDQLLETSSKRDKIDVDKLFKTIELEVLSYQPAVLDSYQWFVITAATHLDIKVGKCWSPLKSDKYRFNLLKSAFVHKKHQVHYEVRTYHRFLTFHKLTGSTAETFLEYIERNLPEGVGMKVTRVEVQPLPDYLQKQ